MTDTFDNPAIKHIQTTRENLFAFRIMGEISADELDAMARFMNDAFDEHDEVDMLLIFDHFKGAKLSSMFDAQVMKAQWRSLANVGKYVVVGAPQAAEIPIRTMGSVLPIETRTFEKSQIDQAWEYLGATPAAV